MDRTTVDGKQLSIHYITCGSIAGQGLYDALEKMDHITVQRVADAKQCHSVCDSPHDLMIVDAPMLDSFQCLCEPESCIAIGRSNLMVVDFAIKPERLIHSLGVGARGYWLYDDSFDRFTDGMYQVAEGNWSFSPRVRKVIEIHRGVPRYNPATTCSTLEQLTDRQAEVCALLAAGKTVKETARRLGIAQSTAEKHKRTAMTRLGVRRAVELVRLMVDKNSATPAKHGSGADFS